MTKLIAVCAMAAGMAFAQTTTTTTTTTTTNAQAAGAGLKAKAQKHLIRALNLTQAQKQQAKAILQATRQQAQPLAAKLKESRQALSAAVQAGNTAQIPNLAAAVGTLRGQVLAVRAQGRAQILALLTPDQKTKAMEILQKAKQVLGNG
jgi:Spy/CpxP family protein refolding chaperone